MDTQTKEQIVNDGKNSAQDFFLYLVTFLSLAFVSFGEGSILFGFINKFITNDEFNFYTTFDQGVVKFGIAALVIAGPIYFFISKVIVERISQQKIALNSSVRKWLTYIVLFFAAATIIGDLITLVVNFLGGDFPTSFLLKVLVILLIAGGIFGYYFWDMRRIELSWKVNKIAMSICIVVITMTFIAGFFIIDLPTVSRQKNTDQQMISNLQTIDNSIQNYFSETGKLPGKLEDLQQTKFSFEFQDTKNVAYKILNAESYQLCGDFARSNVGDVKTLNNIYENDWKHESGNFCFTRIALKRTDVAPIISK